MKRILILKATKDICGNELGLISNSCLLLGMKVITKKIKSERSLSSIIKKLAKDNQARQETCEA